jgi:hypothetical protein
MTVKIVVSKLGFLGASILATIAASSANAESLESVNWDSVRGACSNESAEELSSCMRTEMHTFTNSNLQTIGYDGGVARRALITVVDVRVDSRGQNCVDSVYSKDVSCFNGNDVSKVPFNVEHTWPQSKLKIDMNRFGEKRSDLFHLYPSEQKINGARGNMPFRDCKDGSNAQPARVSAFCDGGFQPPAVYRGMIARGMFYMSVTYNMNIDTKEEAVLRKWNKEFPVTAAERERDSRINNLQGNHNPFIAHPEWVETISDF